VVRARFFNGEKDLPFINGIIALTISEDIVNLLDY
jgi:hypothetical protein